jgi:hypothetical protein
LTLTSTVAILVTVHKHNVYAAKENPQWQDWKFSSARGDGAVPVWSAANTVGNSLPGSLPSFSEHATIFDDKGVDLISSAPGFCDGRDLPAYDDRRG